MSSPHLSCGCHDRHILAGLPRSACGRGGRRPRRHRAGRAAARSPWRGQHLAGVLAGPPAEDIVARLETEAEEEEHALEAIKERNAHGHVTNRD